MADQKPTAPAATTPAKGNGSTDELDALKAKNAALEADLAAAHKSAESGGLSADDLALVAAKVEAGLTPEQAKAVVRNQKAHDAALAKKG